MSQNTPHTHLSSDQVDANSDPIDVAESIIDDALADDLDQVYATEEAAEAAGVPVPGPDEMDRVAEAVEDAEDREIDAEFADLADLFDDDDRRDLF